MAWQWLPGTAPALLQATVALAAAIAVLLRDVRSPQARLLASFLFAVGMEASMRSLSGSWFEGRAFIAAQSLDRMAKLAMPVLLLAFVLHYPNPRFGMKSGQVEFGAWLITLGLWTAVLFEPRLWFEWQVHAPGDLGPSRVIAPGDFGPFVYASAFMAVSIGITAVALCNEALREPEASLRRVETATAMAFGVALAGRTATRLDNGLLVQPETIMARVQFLTGWIHVIAVLVLLGLLVRWAWSREHKGVPAVLAWSIAIPFAAHLLYWPFDPSGDLERWASAIWSLAIPLFTAYAILRTQLFDIDLRLRIPFTAGTIAAPFVVVFFVLNEALEDRLPDGNWIVGMGGAALLALAIRPIQTWSIRLAQRALPDARRPEEHPDPTVLYRDQVLLAQHDGHIRARERTMLDHLADRLGLAAEQRRRIEADCAPSPQPS